MGRSKYENETTYTGDFLNGLKHGHGRLENEEKGLSYEGCWFKDHIHGEGEYIERNGIKYKGCW
jgi:hypothetical protein